MISSGHPGEAAIVDDLTIDYPAHRPSPAHRAVDGVSLRVGANEVIGLVGETGSGKSTLARVLAGDLTNPRGTDPAPVISGGQAHVLGHALRGIRRKELTQLTFHVAYLPQDAAARLAPELTVADIIAEPILVRDRHYNRKAVGLRVATMLDQVQLPLALLDKYPFELSSGQKQRVAIARSLVLSPRLFIADEPTAGIDVTVRASISEMIEGLRLEGNFAAILVSHDLALLRHTTRRVAALHQGRMVGLAPIDDLLTERPHPFLAGLAEADEHANATANRPA
ncbi:ABC-type glutathione transport system ATPase component [Okibacterium sp. HSC-33S16]|uniref:ATP-binding cassette domain-containing protein n=1 Tax=Okibacterium sp. HSC-33S16 TaxID=2910965 RepID=UPI00209D00A3|nr:dipeptide/oligopeptide/nickel ABC transporter ATP-binding protein [Okibacterium sp. HSC-33S16]MCP2030723.1 ABC-type glutathione transport system ATPase component [Okibacterium sp. HSC-33S16]